jgi:hypothetical protein
VRSAVPVRPFEAQVPRVLRQDATRALRPQAPKWQVLLRAEPRVRRQVLQRKRQQPEPRHGSRKEPES